MDNNRNNHRQAFSQTHSERRPDDYLESHVFQENDNAFALVPENGTLGITGGVVVQSYTNNHGIHIYVVRRNAPGVIEYHLPRWLLFHYHEDAVFRRDHMFSPEDEASILQYATPHANSTMGQHLEYQLVPDYVDRFYNGNIPHTRMVRTQVPGALALGFPLYYLEVVQPENECVEKQTSYNKNVPKAFKQTHQAPLQQDVVGHSSGSENEGSSGRCTIVISQPPPTYSANARRPLDQVVNHIEPSVMRRRQFDSAVEELAALAFSRLPPNSGMTHERLYEIVRSGKKELFHSNRSKARILISFIHFTRLGISVLFGCNQ